MKDKDFIRKCKLNSIFIKEDKRTSAYCNHCKSNVAIKVKKEKIESIYKDKKYIYKTKVATCKKCGNPVFFEAIDEFNNNEINRIHRKVCRDINSLKLSI